MMKEICAQCLQLHKDPVTGKESVVFSCFNQDQEIDQVDFACLRQRLRQNSVQEKVAALWIDRSLRRLGVRAYLGVTDEVTPCIRSRSPSFPTPAASNSDRSPSIIRWSPT